MHVICFLLQVEHEVNHQGIWLCDWLISWLTCVWLLLSQLRALTGCSTHWQTTLVVDGSLGHGLQHPYLQYLGRLSPLLSLGGRNEYQSLGWVVIFEWWWRHSAPGWHLEAKFMCACVCVYGRGCLHQVSGRLALCTASSCDPSELSKCCDTIKQCRRYYYYYYYYHLLHKNPCLELFS